MAQTIPTTDTAEKPTTLAFSPVTEVGLSILIEQHGSVVTHATNQHRHHEPRVRAEAVLVLDLCRARTDRMLAICRSAA